MENNEKENSIPVADKPEYSYILSPISTIYRANTEIDQLLELLDEFFLPINNDESGDYYSLASYDSTVEKNRSFNDVIDKLRYVIKTNNSFDLWNRLMNSMVIVGDDNYSNWLILIRKG